MNDQAAEQAGTQAGASEGYISILARFWVARDGQLIRGAIEDIHSGARMNADLSTLSAFLRACMAHAMGPGIDNEGDDGHNDSDDQVPAATS